MKNLWRGALCCLLLMVIGSGLWATVVSQTQPDTVAVETVPSGTDTVGEVPRVSIEKLTDQSELIAIGKCIATKTSWVDRSIVTLATIEVSEVVKGDPVSTVTVVLPGGIDVNRKVPVAMTYPGAPQITPDENVFLFLTNDDQFADGYTVAGYSQGKLSIITDAQGRKSVSRDLTKVTLPSGPGSTSGTTSLTPLEQFKAEVEGYVAQP